MPKILPKEKEEKKAQEQKTKGDWKYVYNFINSSRLPDMMKPSFYAPQIRSGGHIVFALFVCLFVWGQL